MKLLFAVLLALLFTAPAFAQSKVIVGPFNSTPVSPAGVPVSSIYSHTFNIVSGAQAVTFTAPSTTVTIFNSPGSNDIAFSFAGTATAASFRLPAGYSFTFNSLPEVPGMSVYGFGTTGTFAVLAH